MEAIDGRSDTRPESGRDQANVPADSSNVDAGQEWLRKGLETEEEPLFPLVVSEREVEGEWV